MGKEEGTRDDIPRIYKQRPPSILKGVKGEEGVEGVLKRSERRKNEVMVRA